jgi:hypothetical protein
MNVIAKRIKKASDIDAWKNLLDDGTFFSKSKVEFFDWNIQELDDTTLEFDVKVKYDINQSDFESILVKAYGEDILNDKAKKREVIHSMTDNQDLIRDEICNEEVLKDDLKNELKNQGYKKIYKVDDIEMQMGATVIAARNISIGRTIKGKAYMSKSY